MSYASRQKKRRYKRAVEKTKRTRSAETAKRWFLTIARKDCRCSRCRQLMKRKAEIVYRHKPQEVRCLACAGRDPESKGYRPSLRWERAKRKSTTSCDPA